MKRVTVLCAALALVLSACAKPVKIETQPAGASVYVNGNYIGETPTVWHTRTGPPTNSVLTVEKEGYAGIPNKIVKRSYQADEQLLWLIPGIFPYFLAGAQYDDRYSFPLQEEPVEPREAGAAKPTEEEPAEPPAKK